MSYTAPDFSEVLENEEELNTRLTTLRTLLRAQWTANGQSYSESDSINKLITDMSNPLPFVVKRNSDYATGQLGNIVGVTGNLRYGQWNKVNPATYADTDYWYLQGLAGSSNATVTAFGGFNTGSVEPADDFNLIMYGRSMENFNNGAFSGAGFTYDTPEASKAITGLFIGITLDSGTYYPAYAIFNNSTTPTSIVKIDYGTYSSSSTEFRLLIRNEADNEWIRLYWFTGDEGKFLWNNFISYSDLPSGFLSAEKLNFGTLSYGTGLGRLAYVPRLYFASPCRFNII